VTPLAHFCGRPLAAIVYTHLIASPIISTATAVLYADGGALTSAIMEFTGLFTNTLYFNTTNDECNVFKIGTTQATLF